MDTQLTKRKLIEEGLDVLDLSKAGTMPVHHVGAGASGVSRVDIAQVIELGKIMAASGNAVPPHCRGNVGICVRICFQAVEWEMSPYNVADMSYVVNDRIAYMSQLIHAVVEGRAPLQHRLECEYDGENETRTCTVRGMFTSGDMREYTTPEFAKIRVKNSPLWKDDPDQQLFYYASRSWARKWVPDVLLGVYTREELLTHPALGREEDDTAPGLHARLTGSEKSDEGHKDGHAARELDEIAGAGQTIEHDPADRPKSKSGASATGVGDQGGSQTRGSEKKRTSDLPKGSGKRTKADKATKDAEPQAQVEREFDDTEMRKVKTPDQYLKYARKWIKACDDSTELFVRWTAEKKLRNALGMTAEEREPLDKLLVTRREELES